MESKPRLLPELLLIAASFFDTKSLRTARLVSREWNNVCRPVLFEDVLIDEQKYNSFELELQRDGDYIRWDHPYPYTTKVDTAAVASIFKATGGPTDMCPLVRTLVLTGINTFNPWKRRPANLVSPSTILQVLKRLRNDAPETWPLLGNLHIRDVFVPVPTDAPVSRGPFAQLTHLTLRDVTFLSLKHFSAFVTGINDLRVLTLHSVRIRDDNWDPCPFTVARPCVLGLEASEVDWFRWAKQNHESFREIRANVGLTDDIMCLEIIRTLVSLQQVVAVSLLWTDLGPFRHMNVPATTMNALKELQTLSSLTIKLETSFPVGNDEMFEFVRALLDSPLRNVPHLAISFGLHGDTLDKVAAWGPILKEKLSLLPPDAAIAIRGRISTATGNPSEFQRPIFDAAVQDATSVLLDLMRNYKRLTCVLNHKPLLLNGNIAAMA